nr:unnamed protein product [Callosobruchus analis]
MASPLLDLESYEEQLLKKPGYHFEAPREPRFVFTQNPNVNPPKSTIDSPISAMCSLLQKAGINSTKKIPALNIPSSLFKEIIDIEKIEHERLERTHTEELKELERIIEEHLQLAESLMTVKCKKEANLSELKKMHQKKLEWLTEMSEHRKNSGKKIIRQKQRNNYCYLDVPCGIQIKTGGASFIK